MEDIVHYGNPNPAYRRFEVARALGKVTLKVTKEEIATFERIVNHYLNTLSLTDLHDRMLLYTLYKLYINTLQPATLSLKQKFTLKLNATQAYCFMEMLTNVAISGDFIYESVVVSKILNDINRQIV